MSFVNRILLAKKGDPIAMEELLNMYRPLLMKESIVDGFYDEDLYQELCIVLMRCVMRFDI